MSKGNPIGVYDSGVGGLTVVRQIKRLMPQEHVVYFGDTARVPYGGRSRDEIIGFSRQIITFLLSQSVKLIMVACNTSSAWALPVVSREFDVPLIGMIKPGVGAATRVSRTGIIGVIATEGTVASGAYEKEFGRLDGRYSVYTQACPLLVPLVEGGRVDGQHTRNVLTGYLKPLLEHRIDTLILGCTHYPFLTEPISDILGPEVALVDPAETAVLRARDYLCGHQLLACTGLRQDRIKDRNCPGFNPKGDRVFVSGSAEGFQVRAATFMGSTIPLPERVAVWNYASLMGSREKW